MNQTSIPCNIVILPSTNIAEKAIAASQLLAQKYPTFFTLKDGEYYPHVTLYMTQLKLADLDRAQLLLADLAAHNAPFMLQADRYELNHGYFDANYECPHSLEALQMAVIGAINPIRDGMREKDKQHLLEALGLEQENLQKYGYRGVGELFRPHVTLTRLTNDQPVDTSILPAPHEFSGTFVRLGLFEMGDNGTCVRKIAEFPLG
jgi:2'-5' RNA ligase